MDVIRPLRALKGPYEVFKGLIMLTNRWSELMDSGSEPWSCEGAGSSSSSAHGKRMDFTVNQKALKQNNKNKHRNQEKNITSKSGDSACENVGADDKVIGAGKGRVANDTSVASIGTSSKQKLEKLFKTVVMVLKSRVPKRHSLYRTVREQVAHIVRHSSENSELHELAQSIHRKLLEA